MRIIRSIILFFSIILGFILQSEIYQRELCTFDLAIYKGMQYNISDNEKGTFLEDVIKTAEKNDVLVFSTYSEMNNKFKFTLKIYGNSDEIKNELYKSMKIEEKTYKSLFSGITKVEYYSLTDLLDSNNASKNFISLIGNDENINKFYSELSNKYNVKNPDYYQSSEKDMIIIVWCMIAILLVVLSCIEVLSKKKEVVIRTINGENIVSLILVSICIDVIMYMSIYVIARIFIFNFISGEFAFWLAFIIYMVGIIISMLPYIAYMFFDVRKAFYNVNDSKAIWYALPALKIAVAVLTILTITLNISTIDFNSFLDEELLNQYNDKLYFTFLEKYNSNMEMESEAFENESSENESTESEAFENESSESESTESEAFENESTESEAFENESSENESTENETFKNESVESETSENEDFEIEIDEEERKTGEELFWNKMYDEYIDVIKPYICINILSDKKDYIFVNKYAKGMLQGFDSFTGEIKEESDLIVFVPQRYNNTQVKENVISSMESFVKGDVKNLNIQMIEYNSKQSFTYMNNNGFSGVEKTKNPILIYENSDKLHLNGEQFARFSSNDIVYGVSTEEFDTLCDENNEVLKSYDIVKTNAGEYYDYQRNFIKKIISFISSLCFIVFILDIVVIISINSYEYKNKAMEISIRKILGHSVLERNNKMFILSVATNVLATIILCIIGLFLKTYDVGICGIIGSVITLCEIGILIINILKVEGEKTHKILKGGCL